MGKAFAASIVAFALLALATSSAIAREGEAAPPDDPRAKADALFHQAEAEDGAGDYARAVQHYRDAVQTLPSFRFAPKATTRAATLQAHSEGAFAPYARLEAVRRDPKAGDDPAAIDALARDAATFPDGPTRGEAWMVCAGAYISRLHRPADGAAALRHIVDDPQAETLLKRQAAGQLVTALVARGDFDGARATSLAVAPWLDARVAKSVTVAIRRQRLHRASLADLAVFAVLAGVAVARAALRKRGGDVVRALRGSVGIGVAFAAYVGIVGGVLASEYETGNALPFLVFGGVIVPIAGLSRAWGAAGSRAISARGARSVLCASAVFAAAFLILEAINVQYLEGFNL